MTVIVDILCSLKVYSRDT